MHQFLYGAKEGIPVFPTNWKVFILAFYLIIHNPPKSNIVIHQLIICDYYCLPCPTVEQSQFPHHYRLLCIFLIRHDLFFLSKSAISPVKRVFLRQDSKDKKDENHLCRLARQLKPNHLTAGL